MGSYFQENSVAINCNQPNIRMRIYYFSYIDGRYKKSFYRKIFLTIHSIYVPRYDSRFTRSQFKRFYITLFVFFSWYYNSKSLIPFFSQNNLTNFMTRKKKYTHNLLIRYSYAYDYYYFFLYHSFLIAIYI